MISELNLPPIHLNNDRSKPIIGYRDRLFNKIGYLVGWRVSIDGNTWVKQCFDSRVDARHYLESEFERSNNNV